MICGWYVECIQCDVSLIYYKYYNNLCCYYCGYQINLFLVCLACGDKKLVIKGFGIEKIEDEFKIYLLEVCIVCMDFDMVCGKYVYVWFINDFEEGCIDIFVGIQMVIKGFDFEKVVVVGVFSVDQLLQFLDFWVGEWAFQFMLQVVGWAGCKYKCGQVII